VEIKGYKNSWSGRCRCPTDPGIRRVYRHFEGKREKKKLHWKDVTVLPDEET